MKIYFYGILLAAVLIMLTGCTQQERAKDWGGSYTLELAPGRKLVVVTWKESNLWVLTRPMVRGEVPETYELKESSSFGLLQGVVILRERAFQ